MDSRPGVKPDHVTRRSAIQMTGAAFALPIGKTDQTAALGVSRAIASRSELAAVTQSGPAALFLTETRREGLFVFETGDMGPRIAADPAQGIYVAPATDPTGANGAWVRKFEGSVDPLWFGIVPGDSSGRNGTANSAAIAAMFGTLRARAVNPSAKYQGLERVRFPPGYFEFASTVELTNGTCILEGFDTGSVSARGTILKFPAGVTGLRVQRYDTSGPTNTDSPTHRGGDGAIIRNLALRGEYSAGEAEAHGIHLRARAQIENVFITNFEGDGIHSNSTARGGVKGNANSTYIARVRIQRCRDGIFINGADANIWTVIAADCSSNRRWGIQDSSFLGNTYVGCHTAANGLVAGAQQTVVSYGANRYSVISGQEAGASKNAPSGTATDNAWWIFVGRGEASRSNNIGQWQAGTSYRAGGSYRTDNDNARNWFGGCYSESGQGLAQFSAPTLVVGGVLSGRFSGSAAGLRVNASGRLITPRGFATDHASAGIGYTNGAGGTVTQTTSKSASVTLDRSCGQIRMHNAALAPGTSVTFTLNNRAVATTDVVIVNIGSGAAKDSYQLTVVAVGKASCQIQLTNISARPLDDALVLNFAVIKGTAE